VRFAASERNRRGKEQRCEHTAAPEARQSVGHDGMIIEKSSKIQAPSARESPNPKLQIPKKPQVPNSNIEFFDEFSWDLVFGVFLGFGVCCWGFFFSFLPASPLQPLSRRRRTYCTI